jgi:hypothetical protein
LLVAGLALVVPTLICLAWFAAKGALGNFVEDVFLINLRWKARLAPWPFFVSEVLERNPLISVLGVSGLIRGVWKTLAQPADQWSDQNGGRLVTFAAAATGVGLIFLPVAWGQYYLFLVPQIAVLGGSLLIDLLETSRRRSPTSNRAVLSVIGVLVLGLAPSFAPLLAQRSRTNEQKEKAIGTILDNSSKDESVLDGYSGIGVFRPNAFRYFFFHAEMRQMLSDAVIHELEGGLINGSIAPRFASADSQLAAVSPKVKAFIDENFAPVGEDPLLVRVYPGGTANWDDSAPRLVGQLLPPEGPFALSIEGWGERQIALGHSFRRSQGKRSALLVSVLAPDSIRHLAFSARAATDVPGLVATVILNEREIGQIELGAAFSNHQLQVPQGFLVRGLNRIDFIYPRRPAQIDPDVAGKKESSKDNEVLALESVTLERP